MEREDSEGSCYTAALSDLYVLWKLWQSEWNMQKQRLLGTFFFLILFILWLQKTKQIFMDYFLKVLQENDVSKQKTKMFREEIKNSMKKMTKRSIGGFVTCCFYLCFNWFHK